MWRLCNVFDADINILTEVPYITENSTILLKLIPQLLKVNAEKHEHCSENSIENIMNYAKKLFICENLKRLVVISLNKICRLYPAELLRQELLTP